jgi:hypothetical protein
MVMKIVGAISVRSLEGVFPLSWARAADNKAFNHSSRPCPFLGWIKSAKTAKVASSGYIELMAEMSAIEALTNVSANLGEIAGIAGGLRYIAVAVENPEDPGGQP